MFENRFLLPYRLWLVFVLMVFLAVSFSLTAEAADDEIQVYVDQHKIDFSVHPYLDQGTTLVQLRPLFESLGIELDWDTSTKTVNGQKGEEQFRLKIGENTASVNGESLTLAVSGQLINNHTLVPLRFVSEATGSAVGWNGETRTIQVYSKEFIQILGISMEDAQREVNAEPTIRHATSDNELLGFYARSSLDLMGWKGCHGLCWDYYYFFNDHQYISTIPPVQGVDCTVENCGTYEVKGDQLILNGERSYNLNITETGITLDGDHFPRHDPMLRPKLDGIYSASSYTSSAGGVGLASTSTMVFRPDGTFVDDRFLGVLTDGSEFGGDGSGVSTTHIREWEAAGTYTVINYSILLEFKDGETEIFLFFRPDLNDQMYKIGGRDFLRSELEDLDLDQDVDGEDEDHAADSHITEPIQDKLMTDGYADKEVIHQSIMEQTDQWLTIESKLQRYQWAELDIKPEHQAMFTGFGDDSIVSLTVEYTLTNNGDEALDLSTLKSMIWVPNGSVTETPTLSPSPFEGLLAPGESMERRAVFLFPSEVVNESSRFDLTFSDLRTESGKEVLAGLYLEFDLEPPY